MTPQSRRKKWTEAEEKTLIHKYGEMSRDATLSKIKSREKKYKPIALLVNAAHHARDPSSYPWQWTWKDVSTKIQNMRHQYSLVKQKIKKLGEAEEDEFDWTDGTTHCSNFLLYKVFGDVPLVFHLPKCGPGEANELLPPFIGEDFVNDLEFKCDAAEDDNKDNKGSVARKRKQGWGFISGQLKRLLEMEVRLELREVERECERRRRENMRADREKEWDREWEEIEKGRRLREKEREEARRLWAQEMEALEREREETERMRREESLVQMRDWEERMGRRREEWKKTMSQMLGRHQEEMGQMQARVLHQQHSLTVQFIGLLSQWTGHPTGLTDLHHANDIVHADSRVEGDNQDDQFIVDA